MMVRINAIITGEALIASIPRMMSSDIIIYGMVIIVEDNKNP
jgi:hypothetical protein